MPSVWYSRVLDVTGSLQDTRMIKHSTPKILIGLKYTNKFNAMLIKWMCLLKYLWYVNNLL